MFTKSATSTAKPTQPASILPSDAATINTGTRVNPIARTVGAARLGDHNEIISQVLSTNPRWNCDDRMARKDEMTTTKNYSVESLLYLAEQMGGYAKTLIRCGNVNLAGFYAYLACSYAMDADPTYREEA